VSPPPALSPHRASPRTRWGWGRWLLLAATLLALAPVGLLAAGLLLSAATGCRVGGTPAPCPTPLGDIGRFLYGITTFGGWTILLTGVALLPLGALWAVALLAGRRGQGRDR